MITTRSDLERGRELESSVGHAADQRIRSSLTSLKGGASVGIPWLPEKGMGQEDVLYLSICLSIYLSNQQQAVGHFKNKMRGIFL